MINPCNGFGEIVLRKLLIVWILRSSWPHVETQIPALQMRSCGRRATSLGTKTRRHLAASSIALSDTSSASLAITSSLERRAGGQECCAPNAVLTAPLRCRFRGAQPHNTCSRKICLDESAIRRALVPYRVCKCYSWCDKSPKNMFHLLFFARSHTLYFISGARLLINLFR